MKIIHKIPFSVLLGVLLVTASCKKSDSYIDTGRQVTAYDGTVLDYLKAKPQQFDSIAKIIKLAGMEDIFNKEDITFFAPSDSSVRATLKYVNNVLNLQGRGLVYRMEQIKPVVWRHQLARYLFKGKKAMNDYMQIDFTNLSAYSGQIYASYDGDIMNIGVIYDNAGSVQYAGYRHLLLSYIPSLSAPKDFATFYSNPVASVNINPTNGYIHALEVGTAYFGFDAAQFYTDADANGFN